MILAAILVTNLGYGMIIPILPIYAKSFGVSYGAIGFLISSFAIARLITDLACRQLVERLGYLRSVTFGVIVVSISSLGNAVAPSFDLAVAARFAAGLGSAVLFTALYGYLLAIARPELLGRTMGLFWGTFGIGSIAGAPIGGLLSHVFGLRAPLFGYAAMSAIAGLGFARIQRREIVIGFAPAPTDAGEATWRSTLRNPVVRTALVSNFASFWTWSAATITLLPLYAHRTLGMTPLAIGGAIALLGTAELFLLYPAGSWSDRVGRRRVLVPGLVSVAVLTAAIPLTGNRAVFYLLLIGIGLGSGLFGASVPSLLGTDGPVHSRAIAGYRFVGDLGFVLAPLSCAWLAGRSGFGWAYVLAAAPLLIAAVLVIRMPAATR